MRRAAIGAATCAVTIMACSSSKECDDGGDFFRDVDYTSRTFLPGFHLGGFSLGTNGKGYLGGVVGFGSCRGRYEGALFALDAATKEATRIDVDFWPGAVTAWPDGERAFVASYNPEPYQVPGEELGEYPTGGPLPQLVVVQGTEFLPIAPVAVPLAPAPGGWIATSNAQSYFVDYGLTFDPISASPSQCGAFGTGRYLLCDVGALNIVALDETVIAVLPLDGSPMAVAGHDTVGVVLYSTSAGVIRNDALEVTIGLGCDLADPPCDPDNPSDSRGYGVWIAPDGSEAIVASMYGSMPVVYRLDLVGESAAIIGWQHPVRDVVYLGTSAILVGELESSPAGLLSANSNVLTPPGKFSRGDSLDVISIWDEEEQEWQPWWELTFD